MLYRSIPFEALRGADLVLDAVYLSGPESHSGSEVINRLIPGAGNQGGFRWAGWKNRSLVGTKLAVLVTSGREPDWPDFIDHQSGRLVYYGDNRKAGCKLHDTHKGGNEYLRQVFEALHSSPPSRSVIPPTLVFEQTGPGRSVTFRGLAAPGAPDTTPLEDLVAVWKTTGRERFQNYRAVFSILSCEEVSRTWINSIITGDPLGRGCPPEWADWVKAGRYDVLKSEPVLTFRTRLQQLPKTPEGVAVIKTAYDYFQGAPHMFEHCAAKLWQMMAPSVSSLDVTRPARDGGRDAIGHYALGPRHDRLEIDFALEAKCYQMEKGVGVKETSRLISRLTHRQFGVFVTTSYVAEQAYREIREDRQPVVVVSASDIVEILSQHQRSTPAACEAWLRAEFPR